MSIFIAFFKTEIFHVDRYSGRLAWSNQKVLNNLVILVAPAGKLLHEVVVALR
jgi:hypothetical protein